MEDILIRAGCFVALILMGYILRQTGVFGPETFPVLSKIVLKITLPAAIVTNFAGKNLEPALLSITLLGFGGGVFLMAVGWLTELRRGRQMQAFSMLNSTGFNIGCFALPFVQTFLGADGVFAASMFDVGGGLVGAGGAFSVAQVMQDGGRFSLKRLGKNLVRSVPFVTYVTMTVLGLCRISLPGPAVTLAQLLAGANGPLSMLTIGVGLRVKITRPQLGSVVRILGFRFAVGAILSVLCWLLLPFSPEVKKAVTLMAFSPVASLAVPYTAELGGDVGLSGAINSVSIFCSIFLMVGLLLIFV